MVLRLDLGQISSNLVENAFATRRLALLSTKIAFFDILARVFAEVKILRREGGPMSLGFKIFDFEVFSPFHFFSFSFLFAAVIDLLLGLLAVKKTSKRTPSRWPNFTMEQPGVVAGNFAPSFSLIFLSIKPITLIWASLKRSVPPAEVEYR